MFCSLIPHRQQLLVFEPKLLPFDPPTDDVLSLLGGQERHNGIPQETVGPAVVPGACAAILPAVGADGLLAQPSDDALAAEGVRAGEEVRGDGELHAHAALALLAQAGLELRADRGSRKWRGGVRPGGSRGG